MHGVPGKSQAGLVYYIDPQFVVNAPIEGSLQLFRSSLDGLWYTKNHSGVIELFNPFEIVEHYIGQTTDGAQHEIFVGANANERVVIELNTSSLFQIFVAARQTNNVPPGDFGNSGFGGYQITAKNINGVVTLTGLAGEQPLQFGDASTLVWTIEIQVSGSELIFLVRGEAGKNIEWNANFIQLVKVPA